MMRLAREKTHEYRPKQESARPTRGPNLAATPDWLRSGNGSARGPAWPMAPAVPHWASRPAVQQALNSAHPGAAASKPAAPKTSPVLGAAARGGLAPSLGLHNKERAGELNPLTSADSPRSSIAICQVLSKGSRGNPAPWWRQGLWTMPKVAAPFPRLRVHCPSTSTIHLSCSLVSRLSTSG